MKWALIAFAVLAFASAEEASINSESAPQQSQEHSEAAVKSNGAVGAEGSQKFGESVLQGFGEINGINYGGDSGGFENVGFGAVKSAEGGAASASAAGAAESASAEKAEHGAVKSEGAGGAVQGGEAQARSNFASINGIAPSTGFIDTSYFNAGLNNPGFDFSSFGGSFGGNFGGLAKTAEDASAVNVAAGGAAGGAAAANAAEGAAASKLAEQNKLAGAALSKTGNIVAGLNAPIYKASNIFSAAPSFGSGLFSSSLPYSGLSLPSYSSFGSFGSFGSPILSSTAIPAASSYLSASALPSFSSFAPAISTIAPAVSSIAPAVSTAAPAVTTVAPDTKAATNAPAINVATEAVTVSTPEVTVPTAAGKATVDTAVAKTGLPALAPFSASFSSFPTLAPTLSTGFGSSLLNPTFSYPSFNPIYSSTLSPIGGQFGSTISPPLSGISLGGFPSQISIAGLNPALPAQPIAGGAINPPQAVQVSTDAISVSAPDVAASVPTPTGQPSIEANSVKTEEEEKVVEIAASSSKAKITEESEAALSVKSSVSKPSVEIAPAGEPALKTPIGSTLATPLLNSIFSTPLASIAPSVSAPSLSVASPLIRSFYNGGALSSASLASGVNSGYNSGFSSGYNSGLSAGFARGFNSGLRSGFNSDIGSGISTGLSSGLGSSLSSGLSAGLSSGLSTGDSSDLSTGFSADLSSGLRSGISSDISSGLSTGLSSELSSGLSTGLSGGLNASGYESGLNSFDSLSSSGFNSLKKRSS